MSNPISLSKPNFRVANQLLLQGLFYETTLPSNRENVIYTLKDRDHEGLPSLYRLYMESNDPTEWRFANSYLESWEHWERLTKTNWFKPYVERWRKELEIRMKSESLARIMSEAKTGSKDAFQANKYLLEKGWEPKDKSERGRPSKKEINEKAKEIVYESRMIEDDFSRLKRINT